MPKSKIGPCSVYDFTLSREFCDSETTLISALKGWVKKYAFQLEKGDSGYVHYQGRISLIKKRRSGELISLWRDLTILKKLHISPSSNNSLKGNCFYVMKEDTRIDGPWKDTDEVIYVPRQIRECPNLRPFQQAVVDDAKTWDTRTINIVYCKNGNNGKSILVGYLRAHRIGRALPPVNDYKDLLRIVMNLPTSRLYVIDMPRGLKKDKLGGFYSAIETIKDGYAYDDRYRFQEKVFDSPNIWVFTNFLPEMSLLSRDRWKIHCINEDYEFVPFVPIG